MKKKIGLMTILTLAGLLFSACSPSELPDNTEYIDGQEGEFEALDVVLLESFPVQAQVQVYGYLADGCVELVEVSAAREGTSFVLSLHTRRPAGNVECTEALVPFETTVPLDVYGLPAGTYSVIAENQRTTFTLDVDNSIPEQGDGEGFVLGSDALVEDLSVMILESFPVQVQVTLTGNLPDGCTEIDAVTASREAQLFTVEIQTRRPAGDVVCTEALVPFEETVPLDVLGLPAGEYTIEAQELTETFELTVDNAPQEVPVTCPEPEAGELQVKVVDRTAAVGFCFLTSEGFGQVETEEERLWKVAGVEVGEAGIAPTLTIELHELGGQSFETWVKQQNTRLKLPPDNDGEQVMLHQGTALTFEGYPNQTGTRILWVPVGDYVFQLSFSPLDPEGFPQATAAMEALYQSVVESWSILGAA